MRGFLVVGVALLSSGCGQTRPALAHGKPVSAWVRTLHSTDPQARKRAVIVLGNTGDVDPEVVPALIMAARDRDAGVRREAVLALLKIGPATGEAIRALRAAQQDRDAKVRWYAARALERARQGS